MTTNQTVTVTICTLVVSSCWLIGLALAVADIFIGPNLGALAVAFLIAGGVLTVCRALDRHDRNWADAYEVGKEVGEEVSVRRLRNKV